MTSLFDQVAGKFAGEIDSALSNDHYIRGKLFVKLADRFIPPSSYVLDFGCGPGRLSALIADSGFRVRAVDTSEGMIKLAKKLDLPNLDINFHSIREPEDIISEEHYGAIICSSVIEYIPNPSKLLNIFQQSLNPDGYLIISFANENSYWRKRWRKEATPNPMGPEQCHTWDWPSFKSLLESNGFTPITRPIYFESPLDNKFLGTIFRYSSLIGSLGIVVAQANSRNT